MEALAYVDPGLNALVGSDGKPEQIPADRAMINEGMATLGAYRALAPTTLSFLNDFGPAYQDAANNSLRSQLVGSDGSGGSLGLYANTIAPTIAKTQAQGNTAQRAADISDVEQLGTRATAAIRAANPQQASLLDSMNQSAMEGLAAGTSMTPSMQRESQQQIRSAQASRGLGLGSNDAAMEAMTLGNRGQQLLQQRQGYAQAVAGVNQAAVGDPFLAVLGRQSMISPYSQATLNSGQQAAQANAPQSNPFTQYSSDLYNTNYNAGYANLFNQRNNDTAMTAAILSMIGNVAGGAAGAACWVAREVYGEELDAASGEPTWTVFRTWMLFHAPAAFRKLYLAEGERFAKFISDKLALKEAVRAAMDWVIQEWRETLATQRSREDVGYEFAKGAA